MGDYTQLSDEQLIDCLRSGEEEITDYIMNKYKNLVRKKANAMFLIGGDTDDLIQEGMIGLFKAVRDYNRDKEASFYHFAALCISRQMYSAVQASQRKKHIPLNSYVSIYTKEGSENEIQMASPEDLIIDQENVVFIEEILEKTLSRYEKQVLGLYLQGMGYIQIAEEMQKSIKSVDNALQRIKNKLVIFTKVL